VIIPETHAGKSAEAGLNLYGGRLGWRGWRLANAPMSDGLANKLPSPTLPPRRVTGLRSVWRSGIPVASGRRDVRPRVAVDQGPIDIEKVKLVNLLTTQRRGLFRELGLTLQPSRSVVKTVAKTPEEPDPIAKLIRISGE